MSSKSRKYTNRSKDQELLAKEENQSGSHGDGVHVAGVDIPDDLLHVPETETSPLRYILMIGLVLVLLLIFVVPTAFQGLGQGSNEAPEFFRWERPGHGTEIFDDQVVAQQAQSMVDALNLDFFGGITLGLRSDEMDREQMAKLMVLDQLALDAGVRVPDIALGTYERSIPEARAIFNRDALKGAEAQENLRNLLLSNPRIEPNIRRLMRVRRLVAMAGFAGGQASTKGIVDQWELAHTELAFEYVALASTDFDEAARAELPDDEALEAWVTALPEFEKGDLSTQEKRRIELIMYRAGADNAKLLADYPLTEEQDIEVLAEEYYNANFVRRFTDAAGVKESFEDEAVKATCRTEAAVLYAMREWLLALKPTAMDGAEPNLIVASNPMGLSYLKTESLTREELAEKAEFSDDRLLYTAFANAEGSFAFSVYISSTGPIILRVAEVEESELLAFAEIKEKAADLWIEDRSPTLGQDKLDAIFEAFEEYVPEEDDMQAPVAPEEAKRRQATEEAFTAAITEAGYSSERRDWLDSGGPPSADPMADDVSHKFLNASYNLKRLEEGEVGLEYDTIAKRFYLVRCSGRRPVDVAMMSPKDFDQYVRSERQSAASSLVGSLDQEFLHKNFGFTYSEDSGVKNPGDEGFGEEDSN